LSKVEAGKLLLEDRPFNLRDLVEGTMFAFQPIVQNTGLSLETEWAPGTPEWISADPTRLRQVLMNLAGNAVKFTECGGIRVSVSSRPGDSPKRIQLEFRVRDSGIGIRKEMLDRIFDAFTQEDSSTTRRFGGSGLGLAICRKLVGLMGGEITVESRPGEGSTFRFWIPCELAQQEPGHNPAFEETRRNQEEEPRILIVEDNPVNQLIARRLVEKLGYRCEVAANGAEAIAHLNNEEFPLVLMDCQMPVMDGYETAREIRRRFNSRVRILALTASAMEEEQRKCQEAGMDAFLAKPIEIEKLAAAIEQFTHSTGRGVPMK